jgi:hypothetical protein
MSEMPESPEQRRAERRRLIDLTRREKGLPERRNLGTDRRSYADDPSTDPDKNDVDESDNSDDGDESDK